MNLSTKLALAFAVMAIAGCTGIEGLSKQTAADTKNRRTVMSPSEGLSQLTAAMARQLADNRGLHKSANGRVAIASFVDIDDLGHTTPLGLQLAENLMHEMHVRGFSVIDFKVRDALKVGRNGDFVFSRDLADLKREQNIRYYLSGTVSLNADGALINARLVDVETSLVASSAQGYLAKGDIHRLLNGEKEIADRAVLQVSKVMLK